MRTINIWDGGLAAWTFLIVGGVIVLMQLIPIMIYLTAFIMSWRKK